MRHISNGLIWDDAKDPEPTAAGCIELLHSLDTVARRIMEVPAILKSCCVSNAQAGGVIRQI